MPIVKVFNLPNKIEGRYQLRTRIKQAIASTKGMRLKEEDVLVFFAQCEFSDPDEKTIVVEIAAYDKDDRHENMFKAMAQHTQDVLCQEYRGTPVEVNVTVLNPRHCAAAASLPAA